MDKTTSWMHFGQSQYLKEMDALQTTLKGTITKTVKKKCIGKAPKIGSSDTNQKELV